MTPLERMTYLETTNDRGNKRYAVFVFVFFSASRGDVELIIWNTGWTFGLRIDALPMGYDWFRLIRNLGNEALVAGMFEKLLSERPQELVDANTEE